MDALRVIGAGARFGPGPAVPRLTAENRKWWILVTMTGSLSMILIDETVVSVALPTIQKDLAAVHHAVQKDPA